MSNTNSILFPYLPYNTDKIYTRGICHNGCEIQIPVNKNNDTKKEQQILQEWLDNQPVPEDLIT